MRLLISALTLFAARAAAAPDAAIDAARQWRNAHAAEIVADYMEFLRIPNVAADPQGLARNAEFIADAFRKRGFDMKVATIDGAAPFIIGARDREGATRTIALYAHYDGQPVTPEDWTNPPFAPTLYSKAIAEGGTPIDAPKPGAAVDPDWRLYARSAADDKAPVAALLAALDALAAAEIAPTSNIRLIFDGEEEAGSPHLPDYLRTHADAFADVDLWIFCDGPTHQSGAAQLAFGVRGVADMEITVYGANRDLHSGHYGNWAPGPGWALARLLASMKDEEGRVLIRDFYASAAPISPADRAAIAALPPIDAALRAAFGLAETEIDNAPLAERILLPALNLQGLKSAEVGDKAANVIPSTATASIGLRLVEGNDPDKMLDLVEAHIRRQGFHIVRAAPDADTRARRPLIAKIARRAAYPAVRSRIDDPAFAPLIEAVRRAAGGSLALAPSLGGSLPLYMFRNARPAPIVILPVANFDNNQHAADENIRLGSLFYGVDAYAAVLTMD
jgi:acetylornithine deacetylase/succinyl-diaminopimelate desuccinylase-like protein